MNNTLKILSRFGKMYKVIRSKNAGSYINGAWVESCKKEELNILMSIQPMDGNTLQMLPEGERASEMRKIYSAKKLNTVSEVGKKNADQVFDGCNYWEVHKVMNWDSTINHFECVAVKIQRQE